MLTIEKLKVGYHSDPVLKEVNLEIESNEIHGILGVNGSGKTTLFRTINGWLPKWEGNLIYNNKPITNSQISYLETEPYFYPYLKGREYLKILKRKNDKFLIEKWNVLFDLPLNHLAQEYSTGMKKKLGLLGILAQDRPIVILDEPLNGVDIESNVKFKEVILKMREQGKHILLSSHDFNSLIEICDRISLLSDGTIMKTYLKEDFTDLQNLIELNIKNKVGEQLEELF